MHASCRWPWRKTPVLPNERTKGGVLWSQNGVVLPTLHPCACFFGMRLYVCRQTHLFAHPHPLSSIARIRVLVILWFVLCCLCAHLWYVFPFPSLSSPFSQKKFVSFPFFSFFFSVIGNGDWGERGLRGKKHSFFLGNKEERGNRGKKKGKTNKIPRKLVCHLDNAGRF